MKKHSEAFCRLVEDAKKDIKVCSIETLNLRLSSGAAINLIDVREDNEWEAGRIPSAQHLSKGIIERDVELFFPDYETELVLYCGGGYRSALAALNLKKMGYTNVISVDGGYSGWLNNNYKIEKS